MTSIFRRLNPFASSEMARGAVKAAVDSIIRAMLERPNDFDITTSYMTDRKTGFVYEIYWGRYSHKLYRPYELKFSFFQSARFNDALECLKTCQLKEKTDRVKS